MKLLSEIYNLILLEQQEKITQQQAIDRKMFGPVYHGSTTENLEKIGQEGFKIMTGQDRAGALRNGYTNDQYGQTGLPPPVHHLGYGIYFTTKKAIAKQYNLGTTRNMKMYYLDVPNLETINFGAPNTMMKWWIKNGYTPELAKMDRVAATTNLTNNLKSKYDAVWYKGKGLYRLLDGDQICVYDVKNIYEVDDSKAQPFDIGSKVRRKEDGMVGIIRSKRDIPEDHILYLKKEYPDVNIIFNVNWDDGSGPTHEKDSDVNYDKALVGAPVTKKSDGKTGKITYVTYVNSKTRFEITWKKGGTDPNVSDLAIEPI